MIINLSEKLRIKGSEETWDHQKLVKDKKSETGYSWVSFKYYVSLSQAVRAAAEREIRLDPAEGAAEITGALARIESRYNALLPDGWKLERL